MYIACVNDGSRGGVLGLNITVDEFPHVEGEAGCTARALIERLYHETLAELSWAEVTAGKVESDAELEAGDFTVFASPDLERVREFVSASISA